MEFTLASLWSHVPDAPLEEVLLGIILGYEVKACGHVRNLAVDIVATFAPEASGDPLAAGGDDSVAPEEESDAGQ